MRKTLLILLLLPCCFLQCSNGRRSASLQQHEDSVSSPVKTITQEVIAGAAQLNMLIPILKDKRVGLVVNYTANVGHTHLADTLKSLGIKISKIFSPEHGFRGTAVAGEHVKDGVDMKTGLPVLSLYGSSRKPTAQQLADVDVLVFDIQDVGVRFFTYISTLHYVMEAAAENKKKVIVLDRPNPNGSYVDGPVLQPEFKSFVGMHAVPVVHGLTVGEYAQMINGEGWLQGGVKCNLEIIPLKNWKHDDPYSLPVKPSPNLPNDQAVKLYPSICFFEGTVISLGRGTLMPFQIIGHPDLKDMPYQFTPATIEGRATNPPHENKTCYGLDLRNVKVPKKIELKYLMDMYNAFPEKEKFFNSFFEKLAGNAALRQQIKDGWTEEQIRETWQKDLDVFKEKRKKYLLYP